MNGRMLAWFLIALLLLGGLYALLRPPPAEPPPAGAESPPTVPAPRQFELVLQQGRLVSGPAVIGVTQGEAVILRITADHADELHLHGYDLALPLQAGVPATLAFTADRSGRFEIELHHAHRALAALEVQPRR